MSARLLLIFAGIGLDIAGFLLLFTSYVTLPVPQWETGAVFLGVGIVMDLVGVFL